MAKKKLEDKQAIIKDEVASLLAKLNVTAEVEVSEESDFFAVDIETPESGILIGYHGETLSALQLIASLVLANKFGEFVRIVLNVGDYRQKREEKLKEMALDAATRAKETQQEVMLTNLTPWQRRIIHMTLAEDAEIVTESQGEDPERYLVIKPAKADNAASEA